MSSQGGRNRTANEAAGMTDHEGHLFGRGIFSCEDEIAFVLAGDRVEDYDKFTVSCSARLVNRPSLWDWLNGWSKVEVEWGHKDATVQYHTESFDGILNAVELHFGRAIRPTNMTAVPR